MSYELHFWAPKSKVSAKPEEILPKKCQSEHAARLKLLPKKAIGHRLKKVFEGLEKDFVQTPSGSLGFFWNGRVFSVVVWGGSVENGTELRKIELLMKEYDCVSYDPQSNEIRQPSERPMFSAPDQGRDYPKNVEIFEALSPDDDLEAAIRKMRKLKKELGAVSENRPFAIGSGKSKRRTGGAKRGRS